jgi:hypothetical protein
MIGRTKKLLCYRRLEGLKKYVSADWKDQVQCAKFGSFVHASACQSSERRCHRYLPATGMLLQLKDMDCITTRSVAHCDSSICCFSVNPATAAAAAVASSLVFLYQSL